MKKLLECEPPWCNRRVKFTVKQNGDDIRVCGRHAGEALGARMLDRTADRILSLNKR